MGAAAAPRIVQDSGPDQGDAVAGARAIETEGRNRLVLMLQSIVALSPADEQRIRNLPMRIARIARGHTIVREGDRPDVCTVVLEGFLPPQLRRSVRQYPGFTPRWRLSPADSVHVRSMITGVRR